MPSYILKDTRLDQLVDSFTTLATVSGTSGNEKQIAARVKELLRDKPVQIIEDDAAGSTGGNQGNLIIIPDTFRNDKPSIAFTAHLDTVRDTGKTVVGKKDDRIISAGNTQLGADNRWGLTLLLEMIDQYDTAENELNSIFLCTVGEEAGMLGAKFIDLSLWNVKYAVVLDSSLPPGSYIQKCAGMSLFTAEFTGRAAHSAVGKNAGLSAIMMASEAVNSLLGIKVPSDVRFNIGSISGGTATNVIPAECRFDGEVRAFSPESLKKTLHEFENRCADIAEKHGGKCWFTVSPDFEPYVFSKDDRIINYTEHALREAGLFAEGVNYSGGSDANAFNAKGIASVNLGIGAQNPHSDDEFILFEHMLQCSEMIRTLGNNINLLKQ